MKISDISNQKRTQQQIFLRLANPAATLSQYSPKFCVQKFRNDNLAIKSVAEICLSRNYSLKLYGEATKTVKHSPRIFGETIFNFLPRQSSAVYVDEHFLLLQRGWKWPFQ